MSVLRSLKRQVLPLLLLAAVGCGRGDGVTMLSAGSMPKVSSKIPREQEDKKSNPLNLDLAALGALRPIFGPSAWPLRGNCVTGLKVQIEGDVARPQTVDCVEGRFELDSVLLTEGDGKKTLVLVQSDSTGARYTSEPFEVTRNTNRFLNLLSDTLLPESVNGLRLGYMSDSYADNEIVVVSHPGAGVTLSRDGGQTWFSKSVGHGLKSGSAQKIFKFDGKLFATSSSGFFVSVDQGQSWQHQPTDGSFTNSFYKHGDRLYVDIGYGQTQFSTDNGQTWSSKQSLPYDYGFRTWTTIGNDLFVSARDGVHKFNPQSDSWEQHKIDAALENQRVTSLVSQSGMLLARVSDWPQQYNTSENIYFLKKADSDGWTRIYSTKSLSEVVSFIGGQLVRWQHLSGTPELWISRDQGRYWAPLVLPSMLTQQKLEIGAGIFANSESVLIRSRDRFAFTTNTQLTEWKTFVIPQELRRSKLLRYKVQAGKRFLVFDRGLLFTDMNAEKWTLVSAQDKIGVYPSAIKSSGRLLMTWNQADSQLSQKAGLYLSKNAGQSFERITSRLKLMNGFYDHDDVQAVASGVTSLGYSQVVTAVVFSRNKIFVGTPEGVAVSADGAETFSYLRSNDGRPTPTAKLLSIHEQKIALATQSNGLLLSNDEGQSWTIVTTAYGLPSNNVDQISVTADKIFVSVGSVVGISSDFGKTWKRLLLAEKFANAQVSGVRFLRDKIFVTLTRREVDASGAGYLRSFVALSTDGGETFNEMKFPDGMGRSVKSIVEWRNEIYIAGSYGVLVFSLDMKQSRLVDTFAEEISGMDSSDSGLFVSTVRGLYALGNSAPMTIEESKGVTQKAVSLVLSECRDACPGDAISSPTEGQSKVNESQPTTQPTVKVSDCVFNSRTSKCDVTVTWSNAPASSCLWVDVPGGAPRLFECATPAQPSSGRAVVGWLTPGQSEKFFLAREVAVRQPGIRLAPFAIQTATELVVSPCHTFSETRCTAKISWRNAPVNSCLWGIQPDTGAVYLVACATTNPSAHSFDWPWINYGVTNKYFLAVQTSDPNVPETERSIEVERVQPWPNVPSLTHSNCVVGTNPLLCTSKLTWKYVPSTACLFVVDNSQSKLVACTGSSGTIEIPWIAVGQQVSFFMAERADPAKKYAEITISTAAP